MNGGILGSFEAWLLLRGMRTLHVRMKRQCESAAFLAKRLSGHKNVSVCLYHGLPSHPRHDVAVRQSTDGVSFGGMMAIRVKGGAEAAKRLGGLCKIWVPPTSLGVVESLIEDNPEFVSPSSRRNEVLGWVKDGLRDFSISRASCSTSI